MAQWLELFLDGSKISGSLTRQGMCNHWEWRTTGIIVEIIAETRENGQTEKDWNWRQDMGKYLLKQEMWSGFILGLLRIIGDK